MKQHQPRLRRRASAQPFTALPRQSLLPSTTSADPAPVLHSFARLAVNTPVQRKVELGLETIPNVPVAASTGRILPLPVQDKMEQSFGHSFADVRVHEGADAEAVGAVAYTRGSDIHFQPGAYDPFSAGGQQLLGHELTHVVQQRAGRVALPQQQSVGAVPINADPALEAEADTLGAKAASGSAASVLGAGGSIQRRTSDAPVQRKGFFSWLLGKNSSKDAPDAAMEEELPPAALAMPAPKDPLLNQWQDGAPNVKTDQNLRWNYSKDKAAGGAVNTVDLLTHTQENGPSTQGYFKEDKQSGDAGGAATGIGIKEGDLRLANRAVASSRLAEMDAGGSPLTDVIAKTAFAAHDGREGSVSEAATGRPVKYEQDRHIPDDSTLSKDIRSDPNMYLGKKGWGHDPENLYVEERDDNNNRVPKKPEFHSKPGLDGKDAFYQRDGETHANYFDYTNPDIQKGMNELQWHDALTGQMDRHGGNIFIDDRTDKVTGIDNDAAFGAEASSDVTQLPELGLNRGIKDSHNRGLPAQIDKQTADKYLALTPDAIEAQLKDLLRPDEIAATQARLLQMQAHIQGLYKNNKVIGAEGAEHAAWNEDTYKAEVGNEEGSYLGQAVNFYAENDKAGLAEKSYSRSGENMLASNKYAPEPMLQIPKGLENAVADMPSLKDEKFNRRRYKAPDPMQDLMNSYSQNRTDGLYDPDAPRPSVSSRPVPGAPDPMKDFGNSYNRNVASGVLAPNEGLGPATLGDPTQHLMNSYSENEASGLYAPNDRPVIPPDPHDALMQSYAQNAADGLFAPNAGLSSAREEAGRQRSLSGPYGVEIPAPATEEALADMPQEGGRRRAPSGLYGTKIFVPDQDEREG